MACGPGGRSALPGPASGGRRRVMKTTTVLRCAGIGAVLLLAGCGGNDLSRTFGLTRDAPDEFTVTTRAPLSMPPDFSIRPPQPGAARPQELSARNAAEAALAP